MTSTPRINFTQCAADFAANTTEGQRLRWKYGWNGTLVGLERSPLTQISLEGCLALCGHGAATYPWEDVSSTITTWLLPVVGTLLQAPFESNSFRRTLLAITRWVGSPIASLSYVLWNIKVSAKAALMVDMAVPYDQVPNRKTDFGSMRDSMYLLLAMNQYTMKPTAMLREKEAEGLLRIVLFSKDLRLTDTDKTLRQMRRILARELREMRRRGTVPVFVSTMWFLFAFALSIQAAFGVVGENRTAHDLALGCILAWFPVLIMATIVDRNPIATEAIRKKLNALIDHVRHALHDEQHRTEFIEPFSDLPNFELLARHVHDIAAKAQYMDNFFVDFAGQARIRWHYGAAHPILSDIETCYIADRGRNWLANEREARTNLVLGPVNDEGLVWFDVREFWQVAAAIAIVLGSCGGGFILSFFTPTVGLGCRSGGYTIFFCISLGLMIMEMIVWLILSPYEIQEPPWLARTHTLLQSNTFVHRWDDRRHSQWFSFKRRASRLRFTTENFLIKCTTRMVLIYPFTDKDATGAAVENFLNERLKRLKAMPPSHKWEVFFFRPVEAFNTGWLIYIVVAQTWGFYKTCECVTSNWGGAGGYLDFAVQDITTNNGWVERFWLTGTLLTSIVLGLSMFYITVEWCQQSFLSTEDYEDARRGLQWTRWYRHRTFMFRRLSRLLSRLTFAPLERIAVKVGIVRLQKTLQWTRTHEHEYEHKPDGYVVPYPPPSPQASGNATPSITVAVDDFAHSRFPSPSGPPSTTLSGATPRAQRFYPLHTLDTPAQSHSSFPPAISPGRRSRLDSDASLSPSPALSVNPARMQLSAADISRASHETSSTTAPLLSPAQAEIHMPVRRPVEAHWRSLPVAAGQQHEQTGPEHGSRSGSSGMIVSARGEGGRGSGDGYSPSPTEEETARVPFLGGVGTRAETERVRTSSSGSTGGRGRGDGRDVDALGIRIGE